MQNQRGGGYDTPLSNEQPFRYSPEEYERIRAALEKKLGPEYISNRKGPGYNKINYLEGWKAINLANDVFGHNGWFTEVRGFQVDYIDERNGSISLGISATVRVTLKDGAYHEDVGYGSIDNCKTKSAAFDKCKKEAVTDGMKRALRLYGNAMGNCLYDKDYLAKISKIKPMPHDFDEDSLMRRLNHGSMIKGEEKSIPQLPAIAPPSPAPQPQELEQIEHPQPQSEHQFQPQKQIQTLQPQGQIPSPQPRPNEELDDSFVFSDDWPEEIKGKHESDNEQIPDSEPDFGDDDELEQEEIDAIIRESNRTQEHGTTQNATQASFKPPQNSLSQTPTPLQTPSNVPSIATPVPAVIPETVTFVTSRAAETINRDPLQQKKLKYIPKSTPEAKPKGGIVINPNKSTPIKRTLANSENNENVNRGAFVNPSPRVLPKRSIGVPPAKLPPNKRLRR